MSHCRHDTTRLPVGGFHRAPGRTEDAPNDTTRHWPRSLDEAFRTPAWRDPMEGPYQRRSALAGTLIDMVWWLAVIAISFTLALIGAAL